MAASDRDRGSETLGHGEDARCPVLKRDKLSASRCGGHTLTLKGSRSPTTDTVCLQNFEAERVLRAEPIGQYLLEQRAGQLVVWQISDGAPEDEAFEPLTLGVLEHRQQARGCGCCGASGAAP